MHYLMRDSLSREKHEAKVAMGMDGKSHAGWRRRAAMVAMGIYRARPESLRP